jgi:hypothetical protein
MTTVMCAAAIGRSTSGSARMRATTCRALTMADAATRYLLTSIVLVVAFPLASTAFTAMV